MGAAHCSWFPTNQTKYNNNLVLHQNLPDLPSTLLGYCWRRLASEALWSILLRFCSRWKFDSWVFYAFTRVALLHSASFCIQPYSNSLKCFSVQFVALGHLIECLHDSQSRLFYLYFRQLTLQSRPIRIISTIHIFSRLAFVFIEEKL